MPPKLTIHPPLLNSACPWATTKSHLQSLLLHPATGAITTRTALLPDGFLHDDAIHQVAFFDPASTAKVPHEFSESIDRESDEQGGNDLIAGSVNNYGYSPYTLDQYLSTLHDILTTISLPHAKTLIISITGSPQYIPQAYTSLLSASQSLPGRPPLAMEINLSCPNIPSAPPPAYSPEGIAAFMSVLPSDPEIPIGIKTPPYTYQTQFDSLIEGLVPFASRLSFITATNTLGSCLLLENGSGDYSSAKRALPGTGFGGMAGPPLHPLALGNVASLRKLLDATPELAHVSLIGVGGVSDGKGYKRMRSAGADAVALATALGRQGTEVFTRIEESVGSKW